ncbi:MAG: TAXI family TRAP transporter solute-binding subunit [Desulfobacteraceae bacterium]|nr:TAXI family TRAP transporter solute-binding subunit [Desulfobacteraceae bacterium]
MIARIAFKTILIILCSLTLSIPALNAQVLGIGTTKGGANASIGAAISQVVSSNTDFQMRPQKMGGTQQYIAVVNAGDLEFGISNIMQYDMAVEGFGLSKRKHENMQLVATLMSFQQSPLVGRKSGIDSIHDLEGKKVPSGFKASPLFDLFMKAFLKSAGITMDDVKPVRVVSLRRSWEAFKQGQTDVAIITAGAGPLKEMNATISGGVKYIPAIENETIKKMLPKTRFEIVEPTKNSVALKEPMLMNVYEYVLFANENVPEDKVYQVVKALYQNEKALKATSPLWKTYSSDFIARDYGLDYHPGAVKFFEEKDLERP